MISLKKSILVTVIALVLGSLAGFTIGKITFQKEKTAERVDNKKIEEGAKMLQGNVRGVIEAFPTPTTAVSEALVASGGGTSISMNDQAPGSVVVIAKIILTNTGWVVVHEESNGVPGRILGARRFEKGAHAGNMELLRNTESGKTYYAMIHADNGDRMFDYKSDAPLNDASGKPVMAKFKAMLATTLQ